MATFNALATPSVNQQWTKDIAQSVKDNFDFFRTPPKAIYSPSVAASNITTVSTTFVDLTGFTVDVTTQGGIILAALVGRGFSSAANLIRFDFLLNNLSITGDNNGVGFLAVSAASISTPFNIFRFLAPPSPGLNNLKVQWRVTSGTGTIEPAGLCQLVAWEVFLP